MKNTTNGMIEFFKKTWYLLKEEWIEMLEYLRSL